MCTWRIATVALVAIFRAPLADIERFRRRMGWQFKWVLPALQGHRVTRVPAAEAMRDQVPE
jgi:predicted dithiol-disulfide oxidoreductase (DUF899 family)